MRTVYPVMVGHQHGADTVWDIGFGEHWPRTEIQTLEFMFSAFLHMINLIANDKKGKLKCIESR